MEIQLAPDEKSTLVMAYTTNMLVRGELVTKEMMRVSIWPRSQGVPNLIRIYNSNVILFGGSTPKFFNQAETFIPTSSLIGFHIAQQNNDPLDYDERENNRSLVPVSLILGTFSVKGELRIASSTSLATSLEVMYHGWLSIYNAVISNSFMAGFQNIKTRLLLVKPSQVCFGN